MNVAKSTIQTMSSAVTKLEKSLSGMAGAAAASARSGVDGFEVRADVGSAFSTAEQEFFGDFSVAGLMGEMEMERQAEFGPSIDLDGHATKRDVRLEQLECRILDMKTIEKIITKPEYVDDFPYHDQVTLFVDWWFFQLFYVTLVITFSIVMGIAMQFDDPAWTHFWFSVDCMFTMAFTFEVACKLYVFGHKYFHVSWFVLEFATTFATMVNLTIHYNNMADSYIMTTTVFKCSRIFLLSKLFSLREEFQIIILGLTRSFVSLCGVVSVLMVICYGSTLFCYAVIGKHDYSEYEKTSPINFDHDAHFGSMGRTMVTMFSVLMLDQWSGIVRAVWATQPMVCIFFVLLTVVVTIGLLNVVTGIIVDTVNILTAEQRELDAEKLKRKSRRALEDVIDLVYHMGDGHELTEQEFINHANCAELSDMLSELDFPHQFTLYDLFCLLDTSGHKKVVREQFIDGMLRLIYGSSFHRDCQALMSLNKCRRDLVLIRKELRAMHMSMGALSLKANSGPANQVSPWELAPPVLPDNLKLAAREGIQPAITSYSSPQPLNIDDGVFPEPEIEAQTWTTWDQLRTTIHRTAVQHCRDELQKSWLGLESTYKKMDPGFVPKRGVMPSVTPQGAFVSAREEEMFFVQNKLCSAVIRQSLSDLEMAIEHARALDISEKNLVIILTYRDSLRRHRDDVGFTYEEIEETLYGGNFGGALDMVIEDALAKGADKNLLMNCLTRFCGDSGGAPSWQMSNNSGASLDWGQTANRGMQQSGKGNPSKQDPASRTAISRAAFGAAVTLNDVTLDSKTGKPSELRGRLVAVLYTEAADHAAVEVKSAWSALDELYKIDGAVRLREGGFKGGFSPEFSPFARQEETFFIRNQIKNAIEHENLNELRRSLTHATSLGVDPRTLDMELAYRDALAKHQQGPAFDPRQVTEALGRGDWWTAIDDVIAASFERGVDKLTLLKAISKSAIAGEIRITQASI